MRFAALALLLALAAAPAAAATIASKDAVNHVGQNATVVGVLAQVHRSNSQMMFLDLDGTYPNNAFSAVIFAVDAAKFPNLAAMTGKKIAITGDIKMYHDRPEIVVTTKAQIQLAQ